MNLLTGAITFAGGFVVAFLVIAFLAWLDDVRERYNNILYTVRWLSLYEKELTLVALRERAKGEKRNARNNPQDI